MYLYSFSCRRSGMKASPCNKELCGRYLFPRVRSKFSAMFRRTMRRTRAVWKDVRWQAFLVVRIFRKYAVVIASFRTRRGGAFISVRFFGKCGPERQKRPYNLTEWLTTIERREPAKQGQSRWRGKSSQRLFCVLFRLSQPTLFGVG